MSDYEDDSDMEANNMNVEAPANLSDMTSDGIPKNKIANTQLASKYKLCEVCDKYYDNILIDATDKDFIKCTHCFYYLKYNDFQKGTVTDGEIVSLLEYFELCSDDHDMTNCTKNSDSGGCILCEHKIGMSPQCVCKYTARINSEKKTKEDNNEVIISGSVPVNFRKLDILSNSKRGKKITLQL